MTAIAGLSRTGSSAAVPTDGAAGCTATGRNKVRRVPGRGTHDRDVVHAILDDALVCDVGFLFDGYVSVIPMACWREGNGLYLHGSTASRLMKVLASGVDICAAVTLVDGLVLARSAFHHSLNYRSVVIYGRGEEVTDPVRKRQLFKGFMEKVAPGRWDEVREPTAKEMKATCLVGLPIDEATAKVRQGPPKDDEADYRLPVWAGVVPLDRVPRAPEPDSRLTASVPVPAYRGSRFYPE